MRSKNKIHPVENKRTFGYSRDTLFSQASRLRARNELRGQKEGNPYFEEIRIDEENWVERNMDTYPQTGNYEINLASRQRQPLFRLSYGVMKMFMAHLGPIRKL